MKTRKAKKEDFEEYYKLKKEESVDYGIIIGERIKTPPKIQLKKEFKKFLSKKNSYIFVAEKSKRLISYINATIYKNIWGETAYIEDIFVSKKFRRKGIAQELINEFVKISNSKKMRSILLSVNVKNKKAIKLYEKLGFKINKYNMKKKLK